MREMGRSESTETRKRCRVATIFAILSVLVWGCDPQMADETDIKTMAASWPEYRAANLDAPTNMNVWPGKMVPAQEQRPARGMRPELDEPVPVIKSHRYWNLEQTALDSLVRIGEPAVPELTKALRHSDPRVRYQAAQVLGRIGPSADGSVPALIRAIKDPEPQVQKAAARALGQIGPDAGDAVQPLMDVINAAASQRPAIPAPAQ